MSPLEFAACRRWRMRWAESLENLRSMGQRSWLALLGILIGSASVVALLDIGRSASEDTMRTFKGMGTQTLVANFPGFAGRKMSLPKTVDMPALMRSVPDLMHIAPVRQYGSRISRLGVRYDASVIGTTAALAMIMDLHPASGRFLSPMDGHALVVVLGADVARSLTVSDRAAHPGDLLTMGDYQYQVIGVLAPKPHNPLIPVSVDSSVFIPAPGMRRLSSTARIGNVVGKASPQADLQTVARSLETHLGAQLGGRDVAVHIPRQLIEGLKHQAETFAWLLAGLGGISLVVAGVGVMNVMLMSVRERRREIGVRMALGARPRDIRALFLLEAAHLSVVGALSGALLGSVVAWGFARFIGWPLSLSFDALSLGIGSSLLIGLFFGSYPAVVAARLSPATALRDD